MNRLRELRKQKGVTQYDVATTLNISHQVLSRYELGDREPDNTTLVKLADYFGVSVDYLLGRESEKSPLGTNGYELEGVYFNLAKEAQEKGISPDDVRKIINIYEAFKREEDDAKNNRRD